MAAEVSWPVRVASMGDCLVGTTLWRQAGGQPMVTVVIKASFGMVPQGTMTVMETTPLRRKDIHLDNDPLQSLLGAAETCPRLPTAGVTVVGHVYAPGGAERSIVRLQVRRGDTELIDKSILAYGPVTSDGTRLPFNRLPLCYEYALGGIGFSANPIGRGANKDDADKPQLVNPRESKQVAALGPVPSNFPARRTLRGSLRPRRIEKGIADYPEDFDWNYFQAAPADQCIESIVGNEEIELHGMHPDHTSIACQLPNVAAACRLYGAGAVGAPKYIALRADMIHIEPDALRCSVVWRGGFAVASELAATRLMVAGGLRIDGSEIAFPDDPASLWARASHAHDPSLLAGAHDDDFQQTAYSRADHILAVAQIAGDSSPVGDPSASVDSSPRPATPSHAVAPAPQHQGPTIAEPVHPTQHSAQVPPVQEVVAAPVSLATPQAPQHQAPQHQAPQHQAPQHQAPQHQAPQHQAPQQASTPQASTPQASTPQATDAHQAYAAAHAQYLAAQQQLAAAQQHYAASHAPSTPGAGSAPAPAQPQAAQLAPPGRQGFAQAHGPRASSLFRPDEAKPTGATAPAMRRQQHTLDIAPTPAAAVDADADDDDLAETKDREQDAAHVTLDDTHPKSVVAPTNQPNAGAPFPLIRPRKEDSEHD